MRPSSLARPAALTFCVALLTGCGHTVPVHLPELADSTECQALVDRWPAEVSDLLPRDVSPASPAARAWGDPAVVAVCGQPALTPTTAACLTVDDIDWVIEPVADGTRFTTYGRTPALEVYVPETYAPEPLLLPAFGPAAGALPPNGRQCL